MRFSVGAVNVRSGNLVCFDTETHRIGPEHVMASGALPPGFPAVEIDGEHYWDGGLVSNTPLEWVVESMPRQDTLAFQVDLWSARGDFPRHIAEVETRRKEIIYSSRTRASTSSFKRMQRMRHAAAKLSADMPEHVRNSPEMEVLQPMLEHKAYNIVQLIYRAKTYEGESKDYEFSRRSMEEHWRAGYHDAVRTLRHKEVLRRSKTPDGVFTFDLHIDLENGGHHDRRRDPQGRLCDADYEPSLSPWPVPLRQPRIPHHHLSNRSGAPARGRPRTTDARRAVGEVRVHPHARFHRVW